MTHVASPRLDEREDGDAIQTYLAKKTQQRTVPNVFVSKLLCVKFWCHETDCAVSGSKHIGGKTNDTPAFWSIWYVHEGSDDTEAAHKGNKLKELLAAWIEWKNYDTWDKKSTNTMQREICDMIEPFGIGYDININFHTAEQRKALDFVKLGIGRCDFPVWRSRQYFCHVRYSCKTLRPIHSVRYVSCPPSGSCFRHMHYTLLPGIVPVLLRPFCWRQGLARDTTTGQLILSTVWRLLIWTFFSPRLAFIAADIVYHGQFVHLTR